MIEPGPAAGRGSVAILHYSAPPVVGGVEAVIAAQVREFIAHGYRVSVIAGRGEPGSLASGAGFQRVPLMDSRHSEIIAASRRLEAGELHADFERLTGKLYEALEPLLRPFEHVIVHNIFTKHFNLPLTAALVRLVEAGALSGCLAWCHDLSWTSQNSRARLYPGYPWDQLRRPLPGLTYVTVSEERRAELSRLLEIPAGSVHVVYNGIDPQALLALPPECCALVERLDLLDGDPLLLMPVRVTRAKNIEYALHVTAALHTLGRRPKLVITGPPDPHDSHSLAYYRSLQSLRDELGLSGSAFFIFESGTQAEAPGLDIDYPVVAGLLRLSDLIFMPSHREGFGMPVLEAGLAGVPIACSAVPAARELGGVDLLIFDPDQPPGRTAAEILALLDGSPAARLRWRVRRQYTWTAIFERDLEPLLALTPISPDEHIRPDVLIRALPKPGEGDSARFLLFLDYDGTLADFAPTPEDVTPDPEVIDLLRRLAAHPSLRVAVISGRRLSHLRELVPVEGCILAGIYGIERVTSEGERVEMLHMETIRPVLARLKPRWEQIIAGQPGMYLEDKGWSLALHARFAGEEAARQAVEAASREARQLIDLEDPQGLFRQHGGPRFYEICPVIADKGRVVQDLLEKYPWPGARPLYIGDDYNDEEAFKVVNAHGGLTILVARQPRPSAASFRLESPQAVRRWLEQLLDSMPQQVRR